jgi:hypothetical protein
MAQRKPDFEKLRGTEFLPLWDELFLHVCTTHEDDIASTPNTFEGVLASLEEHRSTFRKALQQRRFTFRVLHAFCKGIPERKQKALDSKEGLITNLAVLTLNGDLENFVRALCDIVKFVDHSPLNNFYVLTSSPFGSKLDLNELDDLIDQLEECATSIPASLLVTEVESFTTLLSTCDSFKDDSQVVPGRRKLMQKWLEKIVGYVSTSCFSL